MTTADVARAWPKTILDANSAALNRACLALQPEWQSSRRLRVCVWPGWPEHGAFAFPPLGPKNLASLSGFLSYSQSSVAILPATHGTTNDFIPIGSMNEEELQCLTVLLVC